MKTCSWCKTDKNEADFNKDKNSKDGLLGRCRLCISRRVKERHLLSPEIRRASRRAYYYKAKNKVMETKKRYRSRHPKKVTEERNRYREKYPEKTKAHKICQKIKLRGFHLHHWSYENKNNKSLIALTKEEHYFIHKKITYDGGRFLYKRADTDELLCSVNASIEYYSGLLHRPVCEFKR